MTGAGRSPEAVRRDVLDHVITARCIELTLVDCARRGVTPGPVHSAAGHEWIAGVVRSACGPADWLVPHYRSHPWFLAWGHPRADVLRLVLDPHFVGDDVIHLQPAVPRMTTPSGIVGQQVPVGAGVAAALRAQGDGGVGIVTCGDGSLTIGLFLETVVAAVANHLPLVVVVEDNGVQNYAPTADVTTTVTPSALAGLTGAHPVRTEADDVDAALAAVEEAMAAARAGTPAIVEARCRLEHPHLFRPGGEAITARGTTLPEPVLVADHVLALARRCGLGDDAVHERAEAERAATAAEAERIVAERDRRSRPQPTRPAPRARPVDVPAAASATPIRTWVDQAMADGEALWLCQAGLREANGPLGAERSLEFPIAERTMLGVGIGASLAGTRTLVDVSVVNFSLVGLDMLATALPTYRRRATTPAAGFLAIGAVGTGHQVGEQHDWDCLDLLATLPVDRVVVPGSRAQGTGAVAEWWGGDEAWIVALPLTVMLDLDPPGPPLTAGDDPDRAEVIVVAWGYDVADAGRAVARAQEEGQPVAGHQVVDLLHPLEGLGPMAPDATAVVVATESEGASGLDRVARALAARGHAVHLLHRPRGSRGRTDDILDAVRTARAARAGA